MVLDMAGIFKNGLAEGAAKLLQYIIRKTCSLGNTKIMNSWLGFAGISQDYWEKILTVRLKEDTLLIDSGTTTKWRRDTVHIWHWWQCPWFFTAVITNENSWPHSTKEFKVIWVRLGKDTIRICVILRSSVYSTGITEGSRCEPRLLMQIAKSKGDA